MVYAFKNNPTSRGFFVSKFKGRVKLDKNHTHVQPLFMRSFFSHLIAAFSLDYKKVIMMLKIFHLRTYMYI